MENDSYIRIKPLEWFKENVFCGYNNLSENKKTLLENFIQINSNVWPKLHTPEERYDYCPTYLLSKFCGRKFIGRLGSDHRGFPEFFNFSSSDDMNMWFHRSFFYIIEPKNTIKDIVEYCKSGYCIRECEGCVLEKYKEEGK